MVSQLTFTRSLDAREAKLKFFFHTQTQKEALDALNTFIEERVFNKKIILMLEKDVGWLSLQPVRMQQRDVI